MPTTPLTWTQTAAPIETADAIPAARIGRRYLFGLATLFAAGLLAALLVRLELLAPDGRWLSGDACGRLMSIHSLLMVYFVAIPGLPALLTNFHLPTALGVRNVAFPRLNLLAWHLFAAGGALLLLTALLGGVKVGWTFSDAHDAAYAQGPVLLVVAAVLLAALSSVLTAINAFTTVQRMPRGGGAGIPLSASALQAAGLILIVATPVLAAALVLIVVERLSGAGLMTPAVGGDPSFVRHLFWFYATPALYAVFLPALGVMADIAEDRAGRPLFGRRLVRFAFYAMVPVSFLLWGRHFLNAPQSLTFGLTSSLLNHLVIAPLAMMLALVAATLASRRGPRDAAGLYAWGFVVYSILGALSGLPMASGSLNKLLHNTQYTVAHFHVLLVGAVLSGALAAIHHYLPRWIGRTPPAEGARQAAHILLAGVLLTFAPLFALGLRGLPMRLHTYPAEFQVGHVLATAGVTVFVAGLAMAVVQLLRAPRAGAAT